MRKWLTTYNNKTNRITKLISKINKVPLEGDLGGFFND